MYRNVLEEWIHFPSYQAARQSSPLSARRLTHESPLHAVQKNLLKSRWKYINFGCDLYQLNKPLPAIVLSVHIVELPHHSNGHWPCSYQSSIWVTVNPQIDFSANTRVACQGGPDLICMQMCEVNNNSCLNFKIGVLSFKAEKCNCTQDQKLFVQFRTQGKYHFERSKKLQAIFLGNKL